jgi:hypothetical protein
MPSSVVAYEKALRPPQQNKLAALFAPEHAFDVATQIFTEKVIHPFVYGDSRQDPLGQNQNFQLNLLLGGAATKESLATLLRGKSARNSPALLFSGSHGMVFRRDDARQSDCQGALVCQDWRRFGSISENDWFSAADLPSDARIHGMIHFLFACYGGGWEKFDTFARNQMEVRTRMLQPPRSRGCRRQCWHILGVACSQSWPMLIVRGAIHSRTIREHRNATVYVMYSLAY